MLLTQALSVGTSSPSPLLMMNMLAELGARNHTPP